ncbi:MAG TPA: DUF5668 domain-containing protein, partial [Nitrosopumilaceae archaeon]|nr:DUF5668 domain-containing protein [Nitrosopumilaceae archaeon]
MEALLPLILPKNTMQTDEKNNTGNPNMDWDNRFDEYKKRSKKGKIVGGILIVIIGAAMLAREIGVFFPDWLFSWQMLLIVIGLFIGIKHSFRNFAWAILMLIGGAFLLEDFIPDMHIRIYFWPLLIIGIGLLMIFKPRRKYDSEYYRNKWERKYRHKWNKHFCTYNEGA